ncbi:MAG: hypothetical protein V3T88_05050, partial [Nitrosomonadaceae bacterium]
MVMQLDTSKLSQAGFKKTVSHDNCIVLDIGTGSFPRYIEVRPPGDDGSRQTAIWDGIFDLAVNDKVIAIEYAANPIWRVSAMGGSDSGVGKVRVNKVWSSDFGLEALLTDINGNVGIGVISPSGLLDVRGGNVFIGDSTDTGVGSSESHGAAVFKATGSKARTASIWMSDLSATGLKIVDTSTGTIHIDNTTGAHVLIAESGSNVGIGTITPDKTLEVFNNSQSQLRLSFEDSVKFADLTVDTSHNLTIDPSSTGAIKLAADVTVTNLISHEGDADNIIAFTDDAQTFTVGNEVLLTLTEDGSQDIVKIGDGGDVDINFNDTMFSQGSDGFVGFNTATPGQRIDVVEDGASGVLRFTAYKASNSAISGQLNFRAARGTLASPTALLSGDRIGTFSGHGNDGAGFDAPFDVAITFNADQNWTGSAQGTNISFENTELDTTSRSAMMIIKSTGRVGIQRDSPLAMLHVDQPSTTGAIPTLFLDQGDLDVECIKFSSSGATRDIVLFKINMTDLPTMLWDESKDGLNWSKSFLIEGALETNGERIVSTETF